MCVLLYLRLALLKTQKLCYATLYVLTCGERCFKARAHERWPLAVGSKAIKMTCCYPVSSDTTEKDNNICNALGPRAALPDRRAPVICTGFPCLVGISWRWFVDCGLTGFSVCAWCCRSLLDDLQQMLDPQGLNVDVTRQTFETALKDWTAKVKNKVNISW